MLEIEKRFLLKTFPNIIDFDKKYDIVQVYWNFKYEDNCMIIKNIRIPINDKIFNENNLLRLRILDNKNHIILNQKTGKSPIKNEMEKIIFNNDLYSLIKNSEIKIHKIRYENKYENFTLFIDRFLDNYEGLIICEIEYKKKEYLNIDIPEYLENYILNKKVPSNKQLFLKISNNNNFNIKENYL